MSRARTPSLEDVWADRSRRRLRDYVRFVTWPAVEPATRFVGGFHIDAICDHLEAVTRREIRDLLITVPPRHTKSICTSIAWPTWTWIEHQESRFLFSSFSSDLSTEHAVLSRRVIESDRYQRHWGNRYRLQTDQNVKTHYENTKRGYRISTSTGGTTTGRGGDFLVADDPHNLKTIQSQAERESVIGWYRQVWSTRFNDPRTGCRVVIMQRGHERDLAGFLLEQGSYEHLNLPTEYERTRQVYVNGKVKEVPTEDCVTAIGYRDPRSTPGELLCPDRFGPKEVATAKRDLGSTGFSTQHQQRAVPESGDKFKRENLRIIELSELPKDEPFIECRFWDPAATEQEPGKDPDFTAGVKMRRYMRSGLYVVMHVVHGRFGPSEGDTVLLSTAETDGIACRQREEIEGGSSGKKVIAYHLQLLAHFDYKGVGSGVSKQIRATPFANQVDAGNVRLLRGEWNQNYIDELILFPNGRHDDQVDGSSGSFNELTSGYGDAYTVPATGA